jgi:zinc finger protein ZFPM1
VSFLIQNGDHPNFKKRQKQVVSNFQFPYRGMRTHIRMHMDKKGDVNEENFIACILDDDSTEIPPAAAANNANSANLNNSESASSPQFFSCEVCNYSSTYKANVIRHTKLVHNSNGNPPKSPVIGEGGESLLQNDNGSKTPTEMRFVF